MSEPFDGHDLEPHEVLLWGRGATAVTYYRTLLPAHSMGVDYVATTGFPDGLMWNTGFVRMEDDGPFESKLPDLSRYKVIVMSQPRGEKWRALIERLQSNGTKILYEADDNIHGIHQHEDHNWAKAYAPENLHHWEICAAQADGVLASTQAVADSLAPFNPHRWIARNGVDPQRYTFEPHAHQAGFLRIGWSGATGHRKAAQPWLDMVARVMERNPKTGFISIGEPLALDMLDRGLDRGRVLAVPWLAVENYPAAMSMFDVAIAPGGDSPFQLAKSQLRFYESALAGAPLVANAKIYDEIEDGVSGFLATGVEEAEEALEILVRDEMERVRIASEAEQYVLEHCTIETRRREFEKAILGVLEV